MDDLMDLKILWQDARRHGAKPSVDSHHIISMAEKQKGNTVKVHVVNILVLAAVVVGLIAFFSYVAKFNFLISHVGEALMIISLIVRIIIELFSIYLSGKIDLSESAFKTNDAWLKFYKFRKRIHGPVTIIIVVLYTIGFYLLTPEFSLYFSKPMMILIDLSYIPAAAIYTYFIRMAIKKEMRFLDSLLKLQTEIRGE